MAQERLCIGCEIHVGNIGMAAWASVGFKVGIHCAKGVNLRLLSHFVRYDRLNPTDFGRIERQS